MPCFLKLYHVSQLVVGLCVMPSYFLTDTNAFVILRLYLTSYWYKKIITFMLGIMWFQFRRKKKGTILFLVWKKRTISFLPHRKRGEEKKKKREAYSGSSFCMHTIEEEQKEEAHSGILLCEGLDYLIGQWVLGLSLWWTLIHLFDSLQYKTA